MFWPKRKDRRRGSRRLGRGTAPSCRACGYETASDSTIDGNGNIIALVNAADGTLAASFEYDPFGNVIKAVGAAANAQPFGFSTKYTDTETGLVFYVPGRYYNPIPGRFINRDPIEEDGGVNLYGFVGNNPLTRIDLFGLDGTDTTTSCCCTVTLIIEVPNKNANGMLNRKGLAGHTGVGVNNEYYDYGPTPGRGASIFGSKGRSWWDSDPRISTLRNANLSDVVDNIDVLAPENDVYQVTAQANQDECAKVKQYWENLYGKKGRYYFYGKQCTTTACRSLEAGNLLSSGVMKPANLLELVKKELKNTCGPKKGQPADVEKIHSAPNPTSP